MCPITSVPSTILHFITVTRAHCEHFQQHSGKFSCKDLISILSLVLLTGPTFPFLFSNIVLHMYVCYLDTFPLVYARSYVLPGVKTVTLFINISDWGFHMCIFSFNPQVKCYRMGWHISRLREQ